MSSQRLKSSRFRNRVQGSENETYGSESPQARLNKNHIQKNKSALTDLTNKNLVNTPFKNMGNASDKDTDFQEQVIRNPQVGRQTRSKGKVAVPLNYAENQTKYRTKNASKTAQTPEVNVIEETVNVGENLSNARKLSTRKTAKEFTNSCQSSPPASNTHSPKETLQSIKEVPSDDEKKDTVPIPKNSSTTKNSSISCHIFPAASKTPLLLLQPIQEVLSDVEEEDNLQKSIQEELSAVGKEDKLPKSKNSSNQVPSTLSLDSEMEILEAPRSTRQLRSMDKSNSETSNKLFSSNLQSPKSTAKNAKSKETPVRQTRSQVRESPILRSNRKSPAAQAATKTSKPKRKTALERWLEEAGDTILPSVSSRTCRKSSRLQSVQSNVSSSSSMLSDKLMSPKSGVKSPARLKSPKYGTKSPSKLMSPKSGLKFKSPGSASKIPAPKKVPVWKTEPKPDAINSAPDDIYGFEYDPSDCKPVKKKRARKPRNDDDAFKPRRVKAAPKPTKRLQRTAVPLAEKPQTPIKSKPIEKYSPMKTTELLKSVADKLNNLVQPAVAEEPELEDIVSVLNFSPIANHASTVYDTTLPEEMGFEHHEPGLGEKSTESRVLAGDFEEVDEPTNITNDSQIERDMEQLFGFEQELENESTIPTKEIESQLVKSTPIRRETVAGCFSSVSPVRKISKAIRKSINRPARIDEHVARDLIRGIRPLQPVKQKSTTLLQYIQEVGENHVNEESAVRKKVEVPPTPPSAFAEPPSRSYSKRDLRIAKRKILLDNEDYDEFAVIDDEVACKKSKKRTGKTGHKKNKRDEEEEKWCQVMNSHFEDIEKFNLSS